MNPTPFAGLRRRAAIIGVYAALSVLSYFAAYAIRFDFNVPADELRWLGATLPLLIPLRVLAFGYFGLYSGFWRHTSVSDLVALASAATAGSILFAVTLVLTGHIPGAPRSVLLLDWLTVMFLAGGIPLVARSRQEGYFRLGRTPTRKGKRTFVIGAGEAGEQLVRQVLRDRRDTMQIVGLIDDDPGTYGRSLHGVPVLGATQEIDVLVKRHGVELLAIAIPSANGEEMEHIVSRCKATGVECKIIPSLQDLVSGRAQIGHLREVEIEDLLGRDPVHLDLDQVQRDIAGKCVLVTGAAGSIGSELARQLARFRPARLVLVERAESALYFVHLELARLHPDIDVVPVIANITNGSRVDDVFQTHQPDYVLHAAAYKHVPMMEASATEAIWNNVVGTLRVAEAAAKHGVKKFVMISTDKAVNPSSVMGVTKRIAERIVLETPSLRQSGTDWRAVRFGNVLGSDGSVVPLFKRQLRAGGPVTLTHPLVERYFMTIPEAVELVLVAASLPEAAARVSILEMGKPVRILHLAEQLIRLSGLVPYKDIDIVFTGLRPGEKLQEELVAQMENTVPTTVTKIRVVERTAGLGMQVELGLSRLIQALQRGDRDALIQGLVALVPEYAPWSRRADGPTPEPSTPIRPLVPKIVRAPVVARHHASA